MNMNEKQTILIVDDSKFNRDILKEILGETYHYLEAENGNQAIQLVGDNLGIDLILLDIHMPQMDGFEVLEMMNKSQCINETPVIMISSEESVTMMRKAYEMGITDYITRPFDTVIVKKRVQNTLDLYVNQKRLINVVVDQVYEKAENNNIMIRILSNVLGSRNSESSEHILHIRTATELMLRKLIKISDTYHLTEADIALIVNWEHLSFGICASHKIIRWYILRGKSADGIMKDGMEAVMQMNDNKYYHEVQSLSNEILSDKSLPNQNYSQSVIKILQERRKACRKRRRGNNYRVFMEHKPV